MRARKCMAFTVLREENDFRSGRDELAELGEMRFEILAPGSTAFQGDR